MGKMEYFLTLCYKRVLFICYKLFFGVSVENRIIRTAVCEAVAFRCNEWDEVNYVTKAMILVNKVTNLAEALTPVNPRKRIFSPNSHLSYEDYIFH